MTEIHDEVLVVGIGGHARFVLATLEMAQVPIKGLIALDSNYSQEELILNKQILGKVDDLPYFFNKGNKSLVLAIGNNKIRKDLYQTWDEFGFLFPSIIHPDAIVDLSVTIGAANILGPKAVLGANVKIGENNIINSSCVIEHESIIGNHCHIAPGAVICGRVTVGDEAMIGANATIIDNLNIANKTILGASSTLIHSVEIEDQTLVGSPARAKML